MKNKELLEKIDFALENTESDESTLEKFEKGTQYFCNVGDRFEGAKHALNLTLNDDTQNLDYDEESEEGEMNESLTDLLKLLTS